MKETYNQRYKQVVLLAEEEGKAFAEVVSESFDDLDSLGEFVDTLFYMHSITDDEQFAVFLGLMYELWAAKCLKKSTAILSWSRGQAFSTAAS